MNLFEGSSNQSSDKSPKVLFREFNLPEVLLLNLEAMRYEQATPVQAKAIPLLLDGRDVLATAQTGTGKTAAFAVPILAKLLALPQEQRQSALIVAPTRELADQIGKVIEELTKGMSQIRTVVVIGGTSFYQQVRKLQSNPTFVVGTPGRLIDQATEGNIDLLKFGYLVIDEADRLLDMGFEPQMNEIVKKMPRDRQTMLFSATMPNEIVKLAKSYMTTPERVTIGDAAKPVDKIRQEVVRMKLADKPEKLISEVAKCKGSIIIFVKTKERVERVTYLLSESGQKVARIHGDRSQMQRSSAITEFRTGRSRILVATDIAARGLDVPHVQHVINFDLPLAPEDYVHRIGRTARAGAEGHSLAFVTPEDEFVWAKIHKLMYGQYPAEFRSPFEGAVPNRFNARGPQDGKGKRGQASGRSPFAGNSAGRSAASHGKRSPGAKVERSDRAPKENGLPFRRAPEGTKAPADTGVNRADRRAQKFVGKRGEFAGSDRGEVSKKAARAGNANEGSDLKPKRKTHRAGRRGQGHPLGQKPGGPNAGAKVPAKVVIGKR